MGRIDAVETSSPSVVAVPDKLLLRVWEAVSTQRSVQRVLEAAGDALNDLVPFDGVGLFTIHDPPAQWVYVIGYQQRDDETLEQYLDRPELRTRVEVERRPERSYGELAENCFGGVYLCDDLLARERWFPHEYDMASTGVRAYASIPLVARGEQLGAAVYTRAEPRGFTAHEIAVFTATAAALAVAVGNAIANDEIARLRAAAEAENVELKAQLRQLPWFDGIVGGSAAMRHVLTQVEQVAPTEATVLVTGETGTGKELVARAIHRRSPRAGGPFVAVHCAAIPETLLASELFGHERGAFTGAVERRHGRFEQAGGGTIFLDEVGELPAPMQVMLLRVLQQRTFERLGGSRTIPADVRIVAATNRDLATEIAGGRFRSDLFYRLSAFPIHVPALRERPEDLAPLVAHLAQRAAARLGKVVDRVDARTLRVLAAYPWPGNVRELENVVERAVIAGRGRTLWLEERGLPGTMVRARPLDEQLADGERRAIETALAATRGRVSGPHGAATRLGLPASTLELRIKRLRIDKRRYRD